MHCPSCGTLLDAGARFCGGCGKPVELAAGGLTTGSEDTLPVSPSGQRGAAQELPPTVHGAPAPAIPPTAQPAVQPRIPATNRPLHPDELVGRTLNDRYQVLRKIGAGGFGAVFEGLQTRTNRRVALKVLYPHMTRDPNIVARFRREAKTAASLRDAHTVITYDFDETPDGVLYIAMELVEGRSLQSELADSGGIAPLRALEIIDQMCSSLAEAHTHGIVHRDIKPENVMLEQRPGAPDYVKLLDFGIAKIMHGEGAKTAKLTAMGQTVGTLEYMSPEQLAGEALDGRSDIYAVGVLLYQCLTGSLPFEGPPTVIIHGHMHKTPTPPSQLKPGVPPQLESLVLACLAKERDDRPSDVVALRQALRSARAALEERTSTRPPTSRGQAPVAALSPPVARPGAPGAPLGAPPSAPPSAPPGAPPTAPPMGPPTPGAFAAAPPPPSAQWGAGALPSSGLAAQPSPLFTGPSPLATGPSPFAAGAPPGPPPASGGNPWGATPVQPQQAQAQPQPQPQQHQAPPPTNIHPQAGQPGQPPLGAPPPTNIHGAPYAAGAAIAPTAISGGAAGYTPQGYGAPAPAYPQQQPAPAATGAPRAGGKKKKGKGGVIALIAILSVVGLSALVGGIYFATRGGGGGDGDPDGDGTAGGSSGGGGAGAAAASTLRLVTPASDMLLLTFPKRIESLQPGTLSAPLVGPLGPMLKASGAKVSDFDELLVLVPKMPTAMFSAGGTAETAIAMRGLDSDAVTKKLAAEAGVTKSKVSGVTVYSQAVYSAAAVDKRTVVFGMNKPVRAMLERVGADAPAKDATPNMQRVIDGQALIYAFLRLPPSLTQQLQRNLDLEEPLKISSLTLGASEKGGAVQVRVLLAMGDAAKAKALQPLLSEQLTCRHLPAFCAVVDKLKLSVDGGDLLGSVALDKAQMSALLQALRRVGGGSGVGGFGGAGGGGNGLLPNPYRRNNPYRPPSGAGGGGGQTLPDTTL